MKRRILITIASITLISGVTAGALMNQPKEEVKQEAKVTTVDKSTEKPVEAPKEQEAVVAVETAVPVSEPVVSEPAPTPVESTPAPNYDMFGYVFRNIQPKLEGHSLGHRLGKVTSTIISKRDTRPDLYTPEAIDGTIDTCLAYLKPLTGEELAIALLRGDCGI